MGTKYEKARKTLCEVARREGVPVETVVRDIDTAISEAYADAQKRNNRRVMEKWDSIPRAGKLPTAVELVAYLGEIITGELLIN